VRRCILRAEDDHVILNRVIVADLHIDAVSLHVGRRNTCINVIAFQAYMIRIFLENAPGSGVDDLHVIDVDIGHVGEIDVFGSLPLHLDFARRAVETVDVYVTAPADRDA